MSYTAGCHTIFHHRYHIVWITKYRYHVLRGKMRERIREIIRGQFKTKLSDINQLWFHWIERFDGGHDGLD